MQIIIKARIALYGSKEVRVLKNIAVEKNLSTVSDYLKSQGYKVYDIDVDQKGNKDFIDGFDAVVVK